MAEQRYPLTWIKNSFSIKIFCSIPNIATGILIRTDKNFFVVDPGDGILRDLNNEMGMSGILKISNLFITHGHHDHVGGIWSLLTYLRVMRKVTPLTIYYPTGCIEIETIYNAFKKVYSKTLPYKIILKEIKEHKNIKCNGLIVKPFPVIHKEYLHDGINTRQVPAVGYKFSFNHLTICYGGDTSYCDDLVKNAKNADLAVIEAGHDEDAPDKIHMTKKEARSIGTTAKEYFLVHVPG